MKQLNLTALIILAKKIIKETGIPYSHYENSDMLIKMGVDYLTEFQMNILFNNAKYAKIKLNQLYPYYKGEQEFIKAAK